MWPRGHARTKRVGTTWRPSNVPFSSSALRCTSRRDRSSPSPACLLLDEHPLREAPDSDRRALARRAPSSVGRRRVQARARDAGQIARSCGSAAGRRSRRASSTFGHVSSPPTIPECLGKSISAPGPQVVIAWLRRICAVGARAHGSSVDPAAAQVLEEQIDAWLDVAQRAVDAELAVVLGLEVGVEHLPHQRLGLVQPLVALVLQRGSPWLGSRRRPCPRVEQVDDPALDAARGAPHAPPRRRTAAGGLARRRARADAARARPRTSSISLARRAAASAAARRCRASARSAPAKPRSSARAANGVTLPTSTER